MQPASLSRSLTHLRSARDKTDLPLLRVHALEQERKGERKRERSPSAPDKLPDSISLFLFLSLSCWRLTRHNPRVANLSIPLSLALIPRKDGWKRRFVPPRVSECASAARQSGRHSLWGEITGVWQETATESGREREREREGERRPCSGNLQDSAAAAAAAGVSRSQLFLRWHPCSCSSAPASLACCCHMCAGFCCCAVSLTRSCHFFLFTLSPHQDGSSGSQAARHPPREQGGRTE